jgi:BirA family transcriptional regulator, biotin operon repressor / biotin---[acetyl-CoA-carboxylase] ligase
MSAAIYDVQRLRGEVKPFHLHYFARLRSTNDHAAAMRKLRRLFAPAIVLTANQTAGRGRGTNSWWSNPGVMTVTFVMAADENLAPGELPLIAGLAVRDAAAELTGNPNIALKWPNDCLYKNKKLAGLLCERFDKLDLIGVGLNVNALADEAPLGLAATLTSLRMIAGRQMDANEVLAIVASHVRQGMERRHRQPFGQFLREYQKHHALPGKRVEVSGFGNEMVRGKVEGIDSQARLMLRERSTLHRVVAGNVRVLDKKESSTNRHQ